MINIAFYGKSGVGKSTVTKIATEFFEKKGLVVQNIKLAYPLYQLQYYFYETAGVNSNFYDQNQGLLEDIASHLRKINPDSLINNFDKRYKEINADVIINDDIRETTVDYPHLHDMNFKFIRITCDESIRLSRLTNRKDLNTVLNSRTTDFIDDIKPDFIIDTSNQSQEEMRNTIETYLSTL